MATFSQSSWKNVNCASVARRRDAPKTVDSAANADILNRDETARRSIKRYSATLACFSNFLRMRRFLSWDR